MTARLHYVNGEVVGITTTGPDGRSQHHEADDGAFRTVHTQARFVWHAGDVQVEGGDRP